MYWSEEIYGEGARAMAAGDKMVTIFGGSGFLGRHAVRALARNGWRIRAAERRPDLAGHLQPLGNVGQIMPVQANIRFPASVERAVAGAECVINTVAILAPSGAQTFDAVHVEGARTVAKAARAAGAKTFIHISAIGANLKANANYARTKAEGERAVLEEFPGAIILRPSIIFGPEDNFFNRFATLAFTGPMLPLIGGKTKFQPVFVGDVAAAIAAAANGTVGIPGQTYELGGPSVLSFRELLDKTQDWAGRHRPYFPMPFWLAKLTALATWPLPNTLRPITVDQVRMLANDNVVSQDAAAEGRTLAAFGIPHPTPIEAEVPLYLERFTPRGQFTHYRG